MTVSPPANKVIAGLVDEWARLKLPVRSVQLDDWWCVWFLPSSSSF
jgi:hypothetical protein